MQDQPSQVLGEGDPRVERAIILQFLRDDHEHRWSRAELEVEISNIAALDIGDALASSIRMASCASPASQPGRLARSGVWMNSRS